MSHTPVVFAAALLIVTSFGTFAQTLIVHVRQAPADAASAPTVQVKSLHTATLDLVDKSGNGYKYALNDGRLMGTVQVYYPQIPQGYWSMDIDIRVPYRALAPKQVSLYAVKLVEPPRENLRISEIYAVTIGAGGEQRHDELFRLYQEASGISRNRLERIGKQNDFNYPDARIFFKLMDIAVYLGRSDASLSVSPLVREVRNLVRSQMDDDIGKRVMLKGTGQSQQAIQSMLTFVDFVEADQLRSLWAIVKAQTNGQFTDEACKQYVAYTNTVTGGDYDAGLVKAWEDHKDYKLVSLAADAVNVCAARLAAAPASAVKPQQVEALKSATDGLRSVPSAHIASQIRSIERILKF